MGQDNNYMEFDVTYHQDSSEVCIQSTLQGNRKISTNQADQDTDLPSLIQHEISLAERDEIYNVYIELLRGGVRFIEDIEKLVRVLEGEQSSVEDVVKWARDNNVSPDKLIKAATLMATQEMRNHNVRYRCCRL